MAGFVKQIPYFHAKCSTVYKGPYWTSREPAATG